MRVQTHRKYCDQTQVNVFDSTIDDEPLVSSDDPMPIPTPMPDEPAVDPNEPRLEDPQIRIIFY